MDTSALIKEIYSGLEGVAYKQARTDEQAKDFLQEGLYAALVVINTGKYSHLPDSQFVRYIAKCAYNRISKIQSQDITYEGKNLLLVNKLDVFTKGNMEEDMQMKNIMRVLENRLSSLGNQILSEMGEPSEKTIKIQQAWLDEKHKARDKGKLVMNIHNDKITNNHIAKSIGISKATMSREVSKIRTEIAVLLND